MLTPQDKHTSIYDSMLINYEVVYGKSVNRFPKHKYSIEELVESFRACDGIIVGGRDKVPKAFMEQAPNLKVICKSSIGVEKIDVQAATELGIMVTNAPIPHNYVAVAEGAITLMLSVLKRVFELDAMTRKGLWRSYDVSPNLLYQKTIGLIGFGRIASSVVQRLAGWELDILVYDPYVSDEQIHKTGAKSVSLDELFRQSDVVSVHVVLTPETFHLVNKERLDLMKADSVIINTSRGEVIDEPYLFNCLQNKRISGAGLDVFEEEPAPATNPLFQLDNVIVTPHGISLAAETLRQLTRTAIEECSLALEGSLPKYIVNPEVTDTWRNRSKP